MRKYYLNGGKAIFRQDEVVNFISGHMMAVFQRAPLQIS